MTSICIVADTHRRHRELKIAECDVLIHCGDFCHFHKEDQKTLDDVDSWFAEVPAKEIVCIGGNHDFLLQSREFRFAQATLLEDSLVEIDGVSIYGSPWCPNLAGFAYYASEEELIERWKAIPEGIDILVTHTPPFGYLDVSSSRAVHLGCPHLLNELKRIKPKIHAFGHVHASHGANQFESTMLINAAVVGGSDCVVRHPPTVLAI